MVFLASASCWEERQEVLSLENPRLSLVWWSARFQKKWRRSGPHWPRVLATIGAKAIGDSAWHIFFACFHALDSLEVETVCQVESVTSIMSQVLGVKSNLKFVGITPPVSVMRSARLRVFWIYPSSRYGRRDSSHVVGIPHSLATLVSSWANLLCVVLRVSAACLDLLSKLSPQISEFAYSVCVAWR